MSRILIQLDNKDVIRMTQDEFFASKHYIPPPLKTEISTARKVVRKRVKASGILKGSSLHPFVIRSGETDDMDDICRNLTDDTIFQKDINGGRRSPWNLN